MQDNQQAATAVLNKYDSLRNRRNKYVHALWVADPAGQSSSPQTFGAISRLKYHSASRRHLRKLCEDIEDLLTDISKVYDDNGHVLRIDPLS